MDPELQRLVEQRLTAADAADTRWAPLVLAACESAESLDAVLGGHTKRRRKQSAVKAKPTQEPPGAYLRSITVEGFRGVGPKKTLELTPGPGLTLVIGRNGSGKSSFAEALEILMTNENRRWQTRSAVWGTGWRNLHHPSPTEISADLAIEGDKGATTITRSWSDTADLDASDLAAMNAAKKKVDFADLGWSGALVSYRPFLSYNELGSTFDEGPTKLHDRLSTILGLGDLDEAEDTLRRARLDREARVTAVKRQLPPLLAEVQNIDDDRAHRVIRAIGGRKWDLAGLSSIITDDDGAAAGVDTIGILRALATLEAPSAAQATRLAGNLREADDRLKKLAKSDAQRVGDLAGLLRGAISFHEQHGDNDCPVCGTPGVLSARWRAEALKRLADLDARNAEWSEVETESRNTMRGMQRLLVPMPVVLHTASAADFDVRGVPGAWARLVTMPTTTDLTKLADHLQSSAVALADEVSELRLDAEAELERRQDVWRPVVLRLAAWLAQALEAERDEPAIADLKAAEKWLKDANADIRKQRFEPIAAEAKKNWAELSPQSNVKLSKVALEGTGARRRVALDVEIDDVGAAGLGVMSQGELHAIALSMFLPRATLPESPFRFVVIDDPVQSMDPARVDGLAHVLARVAKTRQVIVFTHDDRLPESTRRLGIDATIIEVTRHEDSVIDLRKSLDPVARNLDDANALMLAKSIPVELKQEVVPSLCRSAIDAAAIEVVRRKRIGRGESHYAVEHLLDQSKSTVTLLALAFWDDGGHAGEVMKSVSNRWGEDLGDALGATIRGAHQGYRGPLDVLVTNSRRLCTKISSLPT